MGCQASKAFVPDEYHNPKHETQPHQQKSGIITGDSFVGWLFGMPPSNQQDSFAGLSTSKDLTSTKGTLSDFPGEGPVTYVDNTGHHQPYHHPGTHQAVVARA